MPAAGVSGSGRAFLPCPRLNGALPAQRHFQTCTGAQGTNKKQTQGDMDEEERDEYDQREEARRHALSTDTFFNSKERNKETFEVMLEIFKEDNHNRRGVVEFIYAAMEHMEDYNVSYDLSTYKKMIQLLPEGKYVPENMYQEEFYHYPKQQDCILRLLDRMEGKGVCPDKDMVNILKRIFGPTGHPVRKVWRQLYWFPKFKNANPWPVPFPPINDRFLLAKLAVERIVSVDAQSIVSVWESKSVPDAVDDTFIISGQSPSQKKLLAEHPATKSLYVEGPFPIWVGRACMNYFQLRADGQKFEQPQLDPDDVTNIDNPFVFKKARPLIVKPSVHQQEDGTILAVCATGTSSRDALLSWIRLLEKNGNPDLEHIPVIFSLKAPVGDLARTGDGPLSNDDPERVTDK